MSVDPTQKARLFQVRPTLSDQIGRPGGKRIRTALAEAEAALDAHRDGALETLAQAVEQLEALCRAPDDAGFDRVYALANGLAATAGFFETGPFYRAAYSLCELAEKQAATGRRDWPSVEVHVKALRLMLANDFKDGADTRIMLDALAELVRRLDG